MVWCLTEYRGNFMFNTLNTGIFKTKSFQMINTELNSVKKNARCYDSIQDLLIHFCNMLVLYVEYLSASLPTVKDHSLPAVCDCLFNIFEATLYTWRQ